MENIVNDFAKALLSLDRLAIKRIFDENSRNISPIRFVESVVVVALERIGAGWQDGTFALSQVYMAGRICEEIVDEMLPPGDPNRKNQPRMAICVLSDHHKLGKTIVYSILRASGFDLSDYGIVEVDDLAEHVKKDKIEILLISVLMLPSALKIKKLREKLESSGIGIKIIVGGAPFRFDEQLWKMVGADAMCKDASEAVSLIETIMGGFA